MKAYVDKIFAATTIQDVCNALQTALNDLRASGYLAEIDDYYENIAARTPDQVQAWFDDMHDDAQSSAEGPLKEVCGLFDAALGQLRKFGFHRKNA